MEQILESILVDSKQILNYLPNVFAALVIMVVSYYIGKTAGAILLKFLKKSRLSRTHNLFFKKLTVWIVLFIGFCISLNVLGLRAASAGLLTGGGFTALAIGLLFKDFGHNVLSGIYLAFSRPFDTNDFIATAGYEGVVKKVELTTTHLRTGNGADVFVPNALIFGEPLVNYTRDGLRRFSFSIGIDYSDNSEKACSLILKAINKIPKILKEPAAEVLVSGFDPQYVELTAYYWVDVFDKELKLTSVKNSVMDSCRVALKDSEFTFSSDVSTSNIISVDTPIKIEKQA